MLVHTAPARGVRTTTALLACGVLAGPLYVAATAVQALTRDGFDPRKHRYNLLTLGDLGWIHRANYVVAGVLMVLFALGVARALRPAIVGTWGARLFAVYGAAYVTSGLFTADAVIGFPPGTVTEAVTWHGRLQMASRSLSSLALVAASVIVARWFAARGLRWWAWFSLAAVPLSLAAFAVVAAAGVDTATRYLTFLLPGISMWIWVAALGVHLYRRAIGEGTGPGARSLPPSAASMAGVLDPGGAR